MFLSRIIFRVLRIIQIQGIDFTYQESFNTCFISLKFSTNRKMF